MANIARNKQASYRYHLLDKWECGIQLQGSEVKSIRDGGVQLKDAYATLTDGELWLHNMHVAPYKHAAREGHEPERPRKLLMHRREIERLIGKIQQKGLTIVPTRLYFKGPYAKVEVALARGKELHDKRRDLKAKDQKREIERALNERGHGVAFYTRDGDTFASSELTRGPWDPGSQHAGPPSALVARAFERVGEPDGKQIGRMTLEILRPVPIADLRVEARVVRPGRSVELLEASLSGPEGEIIRATAWRLRTQPAELDPPPADEPPGHGPADGHHREFFPTGADVGYHTAMEYRFVSGSYLEPGPAVVWMRMRHPLVDGEDPSPLQRVAVAADSGNGVSAALDYRRFLFVNTDLTIHLHRLPETEWVCLDAVTRPEANGIGMSDTLLLDERGHIGRAAQTLLVRAR